VILSRKYYITVADVGAIVRKFYPFSRLKGIILKSNFF